MAASHRQHLELTRTERLRMWDDRAAQAAPPAARQPVAQQPVAQQPVAQQPARCGDEEQDGPQQAAYAKLTVLIALVERLTGRPVRVLDPDDVAGRPATGGVPSSAGQPGPAPNPAGAPQGWGLDYQLTQVRRESEHTAFAAVGRVTTADGREIAFAAEMTFSRESVQVTDLRVRAGDALTDPLVLNFGGGPVALAPTKIDFDLNADGATERISFLADGNGFLVLDANGNGTVDDGWELFGPLSGDGFAELARHDADGNGWIDEADPVYHQLRIWDRPGGELATLADRGVGAIGLARVATPFQLDAGGEAAGALRSSGVWLSEGGSAGTVHQIDLVT